MERLNRSHKCVELRQNPLFLRNEFNGANLWDIPHMENCSINDPYIDIMSFKSAVYNEQKHRYKTIHFFVQDQDMELVYRNPHNAMRKLAQYKHTFTPDFSIYDDMPRTLQLYNVFKSRWCGKTWQDNGLSVIPTISWSNEASLEFAFLGLEKGTSLAIATIGNRKCPKEFLVGYNEMLRILEPSTIYCLGKTFPDMKGNIVVLDYLAATRRVN